MSHPDTTEGTLGFRVLLFVLLIALGAAVGLIEIPYQALSELGFHFQSWWPMGGGLRLQPWLLLMPLIGTMAFVLLAWGPLKSGRGGGVSGIQELLHDDVSETQYAAAAASLSLGAQLLRLPLMILTHVAGLTVGTESPSASLGATTMCAIRERVRPLQSISLPMMAAIGGGAGLGAAFRSPLLGTAYMMSQLAPTTSTGLVLPCLLTAGVGALLNSGMGSPALNLQVVTGGLRPALWPRALLLALAAALIGALFMRAVHGASAAVAKAFRRRTLAGAVGAAAFLTLLAWVSGGISMNDGELVLQPLLQGSVTVSVLALIARFLASTASVAIGAVGGIMHDSMTMGAILSVPFTQGMSPLDASSLAAIGAATFFTGAIRAPLFCAIFVFQLQGDPTMLTPMLLCSSVACYAATQFNDLHPTRTEVKHEAPVGPPEVTPRAEGAP